MNMEKCKYLLFCGTLALWMAGGFQQVYAATEPSSQAIQQQSNKVTGKVSDATGPIIGASVVEKGTANGTITDLDGNFSLNVKAGATLVVSYVGYKSEEVKAGRGPLNITLKEDAKALDEVVVTALGIKRERKALGYGIDEVKGEALTKAKRDESHQLHGRTCAGLGSQPDRRWSFRFYARYSTRQYRNDRQ